ncbi:Hsp20/alpha crystallin family protein [Halopiger djelfimassiliensis]|uniref:Hsp20/alpha crystallin family protein n=1 Tax=Halopiger djelfimassiliensis TaxID=1293047 RepID=UPI00067776D3|nr:Hsp20/alpha crystallin family protein [Halopiger djelfimassiliensis]
MSFNEFKTSVGNALYRQVGRANGHIQNHRSIPVDVLEAPDSYLVVFDAPGAEPDDVQVRYLAGTVRIRIDRFRKYREGYEIRFPGRGMELDGEAELPADAVVDPDAGTATLTETGTLRIEIPKGRAIDDDADEPEIDEGEAIEEPAGSESEPEELTVDN